MNFYAFTPICCSECNGKCGSEIKNRSGECLFYGWGDYMLGLVGWSAKRRLERQGFLAGIGSCGQKFFVNNQTETCVDEVVTRDDDGCGLNFNLTWFHFQKNRIFENFDET